MNSFYLKYILNMFPICHISNDKNFGTIDVDNHTDFRLSLFALPLGKLKLYIISYNSEEGFCFYRVIDMNVINAPCCPESIDLKARQYEEFIKNNDEDKIRLQIDLLKEKITQCQQRNSNLYNKFNSYIAISLVYIGLLTYVLSQFVLNIIFTINNDWQLDSTNILLLITSVITIFLFGNYFFSCIEL